MLKDSEVPSATIVVAVSTTRVSVPTNVEITFTIAVRKHLSQCETVRLDTIHNRNPSILSGITSSILRETIQFSSYAISVVITVDNCCVFFGDLKSVLGIEYSSRNATK